MHFLSGYGIEKTKVVRDPIYKFIEIPYEFLPFIDHKLFQRLRWVSQLPLEQMVYPSAMHSRFEHSLGVMYLAMLSAISLINNSYSQLNKAFKEDEYFRELDRKQRKINFILAAGLSGLLHDAGHAPFSHTTEEAFLYTKSKEKPYNHELFSFFVASKIIKELKDSEEKTYLKTVLRVLNKDLDFLKGEISAVEYIIRKLLDGVIDVDKGDYVIRDSYHCGVPYGIYDIERLWRNIAIDKNYDIVVKEKGAIEAWSLLICRYKMYASVYKHHVRDITDALLIEIISKLINGQSKEKIFPINHIETEDEVIRFTFWTDEKFISDIYQFSDSLIKGKIENFRKRNLYKRAFDISLEEYPNIAGKDKKSDVIMKLINLKDEYENKNLEFNFIVYHEIVPPVNSLDVQEHLKVLRESDNKIISLAAHLKFKIDEESYSREKPLLLRVFKGENLNIKKLERDIRDLLEQID